MTTTTQTKRNPWLSVIAIAIGALALVITEFLPVGILPDIARDFGILEGTAGLAITFTALLGAFAAPFTTIVIKQLDRRIVLLSLTLMLIISSILSFLSPNFIVFIIARIILGLGVGGFWAIAVATAAKLVPSDKVARASSIVLGGISLGTVISVPAGSFIAAHLNWEASFVAASVFAIIVFILQLFLLPRIPMELGVKVKDYLELFRSKKIRLILSVVIFIVAAQYSAFTYITPFLQQVTGIGPNLLSTLLLVYGIVVIFGNFIGEYIAKLGLPQMNGITATIYFVSFVVIAVIGENLTATTIVFILWALAWGMAPLGSQLWIFSSAKNAEAAQAIFTGIFQLSISAGSLVGGIAVNAINLTSSMWLGAILVALALIMVIVSMNKKQNTA
ncbi:MFS transporter [Paenibacillus radicis (ex Gao et al. 2016)]|uniref:MFS transporter n=1 Tax=Paenibacillus radicis (ex Gao et al. 2016) TaxID=1737354 RepID=A0A917H7J2_9BACL|nr:MFS transporter [Paenibacillus radicis (ex Gao et al. 2016)]GGG70073.1 MFS transporter [Paenibacillus radicis (ex Gao et al. 2016)]